MQGIEMNLEFVHPQGITSAFGVRAAAGSMMTSQKRFSENCYA
jgi:hypothetical protein